MSSFAYLKDAWVLPTDQKSKRKRTPASYDVEGRYNDSYTFNSCRPGLTKTYKPTIIDESRGNVYNVSYDDGLRQNTPSAQYMDYDDFYRSDFQYTSEVDDNYAHENIERGNEKRQTFSEEVERKVSYPSIRNDVNEYFSQTNGNNRQASSKDQMAFELILYTISGIFLILILEQFLQLGTKMS